MAAEIGLNVVGKIIELLFEPIQRELGYLLCFNNNIQDLETGLRELEATRNDVQGKEDAEQRSRKTLGEAVKLWIVDANGKITEAENVLKDKAELQKGCFFIKWCPNLKLRFSLGRKGKKLSLDLNKLLQSGKDHLLLTGIALPMPPINMSDYNGDASDFQSRKESMDKIIEMLVDKETKLIGICGMGGIGKTTLAKQVLQKVHDFHKHLFDFQVISTVSRVPNFNAIQQEVIDMLGGSSIKDISSEIERAQRLRIAFDKKKVVVLLDDVWEEFDLNGKGFPFKDSDCCCKIIYTSRTQGLWLGEGTLNKKEISLNLLSIEESLNLFIRKVGLEDGDSKYEIAREIVNECKGLPLALEVAGGALIQKNAYHWNDMLSRMKNRHEPLSTIQKVLKTSYDFLEEDNEKCLFLICCLFQEDRNIPIEMLYRYAAGLHLFKGMMNNLYDIKNRVYTLVEGLIRRNLLIDSPYWDYSDDMYQRAVKMHDVVRDVGISIAKQGVNSFNFLVWDDVNNLDNNDIIDPDTKMISIFIQHIALKVPDRMQFGGSKLELLQLDAVGDIKIPDNFFQWMNNLKVLATVPNNIRREFSYFSSFPYLAKLKMLSLENLGTRGFDVSSIAHMSCLEILSLRGSTMDSLPNEINELTNLRLLDLTGNRCFIGNDILSKLTNLQELYMCNSFVHWRVVNKENISCNESARLIELNCLPKLWRLELEVSNIEQVPRGVKFLSSSKLKEFKIIMRKNRDEKFENFGRGERQLLMEDVKDNFLYELEVILENKVTHLYLRNTSEIWEQMHFKGLLKDMVHIVLEKCQSIITIFPHSSQTSDAKEINGLDLRRINIYECNQIRHIFPISILKGLKNLQILIVNNCEMLEEVVTIGKDTEKLKIIEFKTLEILGLHDLCMLECFCKGIQEIYFYKLKVLVLTGLKQFIFPTKLEIRCLENLVIGSIPSLENLCNFLPASLKEMSIYDCDSLRYVFTGIFVRSSIFHLQKLQVKECKRLKGIVFESMDAEEKYMNISFQFPNLLTLELESLDELTSFVIDNKEKSQRTLFYPNQVSFPCLESLSIQNLPKISYTVGGQQDDNIKEGDDDEKKLQPLFPKLDRLYLGDLSELVSFYGVINKTNQNTLFHCVDDEVSFPSLNELRIWELPKINYIVGWKGVGGEDNIGNYDQKFQPPIFPILKSLEVMCLSNLIHMYESNYPKVGVLLFQNVRKLYISHCGKLRYLFSENIGRVSTKYLEHLDIRYCPMMEVVMKNEEDIDKAEREGFNYLPLLKKLELYSLPDLRRFCDVAYTWELPVLDELLVIECPKLEAFSPGYLDSPRLDRFLYEYRPELIADKWKGDANAALRDLKMMKEKEEEEKAAAEQEEEEEQAN